VCEPTDGPFRGAVMAEEGSGLESCDRGCTDKLATGALGDDLLRSGSIAVINAVHYMIFSIFFSDCGLG